MVYACIGLVQLNAMISQWLGRRKKISTTNFRLFITRMDLIVLLRCLYTLSLIKLITRNPPWTIVSLFFLIHTHTHTPPIYIQSRGRQAMAHSFVRPFICGSRGGDRNGNGSIQHVNVIQRFCTLARSNRMNFIFEMCVRMCMFVCVYV